MLAARRQRAHEYRGRGQRVHADAIAEQRTAAASPGGIHGDHGNLPVRETAHEALQQFVGERALAGPAGAGDADHGRGALAARERLADLLGRALIAVPAFERGDAARDLRLVAGIERPERVRRALRGTHAREHVLDHALEAEAPAILGGVDLLDAVALQLGDLGRGDGAAATDDHADVAGAELAQHVDHVGEVFVVAALVGAHGDAVGIFLDGRAHDVGDAAVVPEVHDLGAVGLQQPADHVDRGIVAVEQRGGADEAQRRRRQGNGGRVTPRGGGTSGSGAHDAIQKMLPVSMIPGIRRVNHGASPGHGAFTGRGIPQSGSGRPPAGRRHARLICLRCSRTCTAP